MAIMTIEPESVASINAFYGPGMCEDLIAEGLAKMVISVPAMRARIEDDAEGISYAIQAEIGNNPRRTASLNKAMDRISRAKAVFLDLTSTPAPRAAIQAAAKHFDKVRDEAGEMVFDTEPAEVHGPCMDFDSQWAYFRGARS